MEETSLGREDIIRALEAWFHDKNEWWDGFHLDGKPAITPSEDALPGAEPILVRQS